MRGNILFCDVNGRRALKRDDYVFYFWESM